MLTKSIIFIAAGRVNCVFVMLRGELNLVLRTFFCYLGLLRFSLNYTFGIGLLKSDRLQGQGEKFIEKQKYFLYFDEVWRNWQFINQPGASFGGGARRGLRTTMDCEMNFLHKSES